MAILTREEAKRIIDKVLSYSNCDELNVSLNGGRTGNIRYARNTVSTAGITDDLSLAVTAVYGKKSGSATINEFDDESLEKTVRRAEEIAKLAPENPEFLPALGPQQYLESSAFADATANISAEFRAKVAIDSIQPCIDGGLTAAGYLEDSAGFSAIGNTKGLFAYNRSTSVDFSVTVRTNDERGSGYVSKDYNDSSKLNSGTATSVAIQKAKASAEAQAIEPGKYTVILEPLAASNLLGGIHLIHNAT